MISKVTMKGVASYKQESSLVTNKRINLIYGLNGTGKSTLSNYLYDRTDASFNECSIEGLLHTDKCLVYNQKFIDDNFYESEDIHGIFTLSKGNKEAQKVIDNARDVNRKLNTKRNELDSNKKETDAKYHKEIEKFKSEVWKIKTDYSGGDGLLDFCFNRLKRNKDVLFDYLIDVEKSKNPVSYSVENLKKEVLELQGDIAKVNEMNTIHFNLTTIENSNLLSKVITGKDDSSIAELIKRLQNSAWVEEGLNYIHIDNEKTQCPFCQQNTITKELYAEISGFFDETYQKDKTTLESMLGQYKAEVQRIIQEIDLLTKNKFMEELVPEIKSCVGELITLTSENIDLLEYKIRNTNVTVILKSTQKIEDKVNGIIKKSNSKIKEFNDKIDNVQNILESVSERFWLLMREKYDSVLSLYKASEKRQADNAREYKSKVDKINLEEEKQRQIIADNQRKTVNIDAAIDNINDALIDIGITDFSIEKYSSDTSSYHLKRGYGSGNVFKTLSEGEKMIISFLYFVELCKGETTAQSVTTNKIIVIDDPISSLSHIYIFNVGRIIHNEFLKSEKYEQVFILTHSLYFFYELTNINHVDREKKQSLFRITKNECGSTFVNMKYNEIQNDYQAYWCIIKDETQSPALIANCMRNIIEYFFNFVEKEDLNNVFQKTELQDNRFQAFNRYMNRESHSKGQNIFDIKEFDYDNFKNAFELVFNLNGYETHYKKMMK